MTDQNQVLTSRAKAPSSAQSSGLRTRLTDAAIVLFARNGFEGTTVQEVCASVGVTKGGFYHHFQSKDELLYEIYRRLLSRQMADLERVADRDAPLLERLHAIAKDVVATSIETIDETTIFWRSLHQLSSDTQAMVRAERRRYHVRFRALLEQGVEEGLVRRDIPVDLMIDFYFGSIHRLGDWYRKSGELTGADVGTYYAALFIDSIVPHDR